jgi:Fe-S oxidoreductase
MKNLYPKINISPQFEVLHAVEFIYQLIQTGRIKLNQEVPLKVTYHDPCHLGRHLVAGIYDLPREILRSIPGIELVEMERSRENSWCCGAGSGVKQTDPGLALWAANERLKEAQATGANALVTACGWCERNFLDAAREYSVNMKIYDVADLVRLAMSP